MYQIFGATNENSVHFLVYNLQPIDRCTKCILEAANILVSKIVFDFEDQFKVLMQLSGNCENQFDVSFNVKYQIIQLLD